jgi:hypothetical protein
MSLPDKQSSYMEPSSPIGRTQSSLAALFVTPSPNKTDGKADQTVDDEPYINKRKLSTTTAAKGDSNIGPSSKKMDGNANRVVNDELFIDKRKRSSMTAVNFFKDPTLALAYFYCSSTDPRMAVFNDELQPDVDKQVIWNRISNLIGSPIGQE